MRSPDRAASPGARGRAGRECGWQRGKAASAGSSLRCRATSSYWPVTLGNRSERQTAGGRPGRSRAAWSLPQVTWDCPAVSAVSQFEECVFHSFRTDTRANVHYVPKTVKSFSQIVGARRHTYRAVSRSVAVLEGFPPAVLGVGLGPFWLPDVTP